MCFNILVRQYVRLRADLANDKDEEKDETCFLQQQIVAKTVDVLESFLGEFHVS